MKKKIFNINVKKISEKDGTKYYLASCRSLCGFMAYGETFEELQDNVANILPEFYSLRQQRKQQEKVIKSEILKMAMFDLKRKLLFDSKLLPNSKSQSACYA